MEFRRPKGTDDIMPPASRRWRRVLRVFDEVAERYGYELIMTPLLESTDLFARGVGEGTEVVEKQMFTFDDKGGRSMTLRPEATAGVVRAYLNAGAPGVAKYAYSGPMFRYEQPQAGRRRQFWQVGVEYIGEDSPAADVEVIEQGHRFYVEAGLDDVTVQLNSIGDAASRTAYRSVLTEFLEARAADLSDDARRRIATNPLRVLDSKADADVVADAPSPAEHLTPASAEHYDAVRAGLERVGVPFTDEPRLVRGLDYYTRTVFEYISGGYDVAQSSLGGGGRYDGLAEQLGGPHVPAIGHSLGIDRVILALGERDDPAILDAFVVFAAPASREEAFRLVTMLRHGGVAADMLTREASLKAQLKAADRSGARFAVIPRGASVTVRSMDDRTESEVAVTDLVAWLSR